MDINVSTLKLRTDALPEKLLKDLALSPLIYIRLLGVLFSIIVFGCLADKGFINGPNDVCLLNDSSACNFAIAIGVLAFLICVVFLIKDVVMVIVDFSGNILIKKILIFGDIAVNGFWAFMWFVTFCYTADQLRRNTISRSLITTGEQKCLNSTVAFSFFSIILWIGIVGVNVLFLVWIFKGTDPDSRPNYSAFPKGDEEDDPEENPSSEGPTPQYTPPEY